MSSAGVVLVARIALLAVLILVTAVVRTLVGPSRTRGFYMALGTVGGVATGIAAAWLTSRWIATDLSAILGCVGVFAGWAVAWRFARRIPRETS